MMNLSCNGIRFNPNTYKGNHKIEAIVSEDEDVVYAFEDRFSEFSCMHKTKWLELYELLRRSNINSNKTIMNGVKQAADIKDDI